MAALDEKQSSLKNFLGGHPEIKYIPPTSPEFSSLSALYNRSSPKAPLAVVRPQTADHVGALISYCTANAVQFTIRTGGKNIYGLSSVQDALMIDMRDIDYSRVDEKKSSVTIGGGILQAKLAADLAKEGLVTPTGSLGFLGLVGWSTYGGYGPLAPKYGLGLDNILAAKVVNAKGEVVVADKELLKGIRGAGGAFGVIVELTVKVYPLKRVSSLIQTGMSELISKKILGGTIIYDSQDLVSTYEKFNAGYLTLLEGEAIPLDLDVQQFVVAGPQGKAFAVAVVWASDDHDAGRTCIAKIEALGTVVMNTVQPTTIADHVQVMVSQLPRSTYGLCRTISVRKWSKETSHILARGIDSMPSTPGTAYSLHELSGPSASPNPDSVFGSREPHFMLEFISMVENEEDAKESEEWGTNLKNEILQKDPENVLPGTYISVTPPGEVPLSKIYGPESNYQTLLDLKRKFDPQNVFNLAVPRLLEK
jgi:hypothetical protein